METGYSGANHDVLQAKNNTWGLGPIETSISDANDAVLNAKTIVEVWDPQRLEILNQMLMFCMQKPQMRAEIHRD